jgi:prepilin-type processing-associated H-X9-DG protein
MAQSVSAGRTSPLAVASLLLGLLSLFLLVVTGLPAVVLGFYSLRRINESDGRIKGRALAALGMILGGLGTLAGFLGLAFLGLGFLQGRADRAVCQNNLRVLGEAIHSYQLNSDGHFPRGAIPNDQLPAERRLSWMVTILPYLMGDEAPGKKTTPQKALYDQFDRSRSWDAAANHKAAATVLGWYLCPSLPGRARHSEYGLTTYVGIAGLGPDAAQLPRETNGTLTPRIGIFGYDRQLTVEDVTAGISQTLMVTETTLHLGAWAAGGQATVRSLDPAAQPYLGPGRPFGGLHPGGANLLMADGAARFVSLKIAPRELEAMATVTGEP